MCGLNGLCRLRNRARDYTRFIGTVPCPEARPAPCQSTIADITWRIANLRPSRSIVLRARLPRAGRRRSGASPRRPCGASIAVVRPAMNAKLSVSGLATRSCTHWASSARRRAASSRHARRCTKAAATRRRCARRLRLFIDFIGPRPRGGVKKTRRFRRHRRAADASRPAPCARPESRGAAEVLRSSAGTTVQAGSVRPPRRRGRSAIRSPVR